MGTDCDSAYAGPTAKALLAVRRARGRPDALRWGRPRRPSSRRPRGREPGRFSDLRSTAAPPTCDYSNTIGQSLAVIALVRAGEAVSTASVDVLLDQQCADGGFRGATRTARRASATRTRPPSPPRRSIAAGSDDSRGRRPWTGLPLLSSATARFESADGIANANTTGVAAQAFAAGGRDAELADAQAFLVVAAVRVHRHRRRCGVASRSPLAHAPPRRSRTATSGRHHRPPRASRVSRC